MESNTPRPRSGFPVWAIVVIILAGLTAVGVPIIGIVVGFLVPTLISGRQEAYKVQCANNLRQLGQHCLVYADQDGARFFPHSPEGSAASFRVLANAPRAIDAGLFVCPADRDCEPAADLGNLGEESTSYEIVPWKLTPAQPGELLLYDKEPHHPGGRNVVFSDMSVQFMSEPEFQALFDAARREHGSQGE